METYLYKEKIEKTKEEYLKLKNKFFKIGIISSFIILIIIITFLILFFQRIVSKDLFLAVSICIVIYPCCSYIVYYSYKKNKFYYEELDKLIITILRLETNYDIEKRFTKKEYLNHLYDTRIANRGDSIILKSALSFEGNNLSGEMFVVNISKNTGQSSYDIINGVVLTYKSETIFNYQARTDKFALNKSRKVKELSSKMFNVYVEKNVPLGKEQVDTKTYSYIEKLKQKFDTINVGIDFQDDKISFFASNNDLLKMPKKIEVDEIIRVTTEYIKCLNILEELHQELEKNF